MRWPRRHGADKVWLSESEIAAAYRRRLMAADDQAARLREVEREAVLTTATTSAQSRWPLPLLVVSLAPDLPGDLLLDAETVRAFTSRTRQEIAMVGGLSSTFEETSVAHRRLIAEAGGNTRMAVRAQLYTDGAGTFAMHPSSVNVANAPAQEDEAESFRVRVLDAEVVDRVASALRYLARHARDQAAVHGSALLRVMLVSDTHLHPDVQPYAVREAAPYTFPGFERYRVALDTPAQGGARPVGTRFSRLAYGESHAHLDDLADDGLSLTRATARLVDDLFQTYGLPQNRQIRQDGTVNEHAWGEHWTSIKRWVSAADIPVAAA
ncbi:hypothetical protein OG320_10830 [Microbispora sp. NBC_01189]|uniref:hypothetical protein n=1 Tax=Microbispora sp. NBC_01189 TaxID=2903583 RepID=UPI002E0E8D91|nr:hypothetical protein OG320_10830 [Microbispora sp. NBC_01189]